jgi:hypothetical protein
MKSLSKPASMVQPISNGCYPGGFGGSSIMKVQLTGTLSFRLAWKLRKFTQISLPSRTSTSSVSIHEAKDWRD